MMESNEYLSSLLLLLLFSCYNENHVVANSGKIITSFHTSSRKTYDSRRRPFHHQHNNKSPSYHALKHRQQNHDAVPLRRKDEDIVVMVHPPKTIFLERDPPHIIIITEPTACDNDENMQQTLQVLQRAITTNLISLISIRCVMPSYQNNNTSLVASYKERIHLMIETLVRWSSLYQNFHVVISSDWMDVAFCSHIHGIHVKEHHRHFIPYIRQHRPNYLIGTSTHTVSSAMQAWELYGHDAIDYYFAGTCFITESHPEKALQSQLEGPEFPNIVKQALYRHVKNSHTNDNNNTDDHHEATARTTTITKIPLVFAIGGIDETNCHIPLIQQEGSKNHDDENSISQRKVDGVATIRAVLRSSQPEDTVHRMYHNMKQQYIRNHKKQD